MSIKHNHQVKKEKVNNGHGEKHDNIPEYKLKEKYMELVKITTNCVNIFNSLCIKIGEHLLSEFPKNMELFIYDDIVRKVIKKNHEEPISLFLIHVFQNKQYRQAIMDSDENFFKSNRHDNLTSSDEDRIKAMFQFKSCWNEMNDESKNYIKAAFKKMVELCDTYLNTKCDQNKIASVIRHNEPF